MSRVREGVAQSVGPGPCVLARTPFLQTSPGGAATGRGPAQAEYHAAERHREQAPPQVQVYSQAFLGLGSGAQDAVQHQDGAEDQDDRGDVEPYREAVAVPLVIRYAFLFSYARSSGIPLLP